MQRKQPNIHGMELFRARVDKTLGQKERERIEFELNLKPSIGDYASDTRADAPRNLKERIFALLDSRRPDGGEKSPTKRQQEGPKKTHPNASSFSNLTLKPTKNPATEDRRVSFAIQEESSDVHMTSQAPTARLEPTLNKRSLSQSERVLEQHEQFLQTLASDYRRVASKPTVDLKVLNSSRSMPRAFPHSRIIKQTTRYL